MLNVAFGGGPSWSLMCPYDTSTLPEPVLAEAMRAHPTIVVDGERRASDRYDGDAHLARDLAGTLVEAGVEITRVPFAGDSLIELRDRVMRRGRRGGVSHDRLEDLALAVHELATNSVRYARRRHSTDLGHRLRRRRRDRRRRPGHRSARRPSPSAARFRGVVADSGWSTNCAISWSCGPRPTARSCECRWTPTHSFDAISWALA